MSIENLTNKQIRKMILRKTPASYLLDDPNLNENKTKIENTQKSTIDNSNSGNITVSPEINPKINVVVNIEDQKKKKKKEKKKNKRKEKKNLKRKEKKQTSKKSKPKKEIAKIQKKDENGKFSPFYSTNQQTFSYPNTKNIYNNPDSEEFPITGSSITSDKDFGEKATTKLKVDKNIKPRLKTKKTERAKKQLIKDPVLDQKVNIYDDTIQEFNETIKGFDDFLDDLKKPTLHDNSIKTEDMSQKRFSSIINELTSEKYLNEGIQMIHNRIIADENIKARKYLYRAAKSIEAAQKFEKDGSLEAAILQYETAQFSIETSYFEKEGHYRNPKDAVEDADTLKMKIKKLNEKWEKEKKNDKVFKKDIIPEITEDDIENTFNDLFDDLSEFSIGTEGASLEDKKSKIEKEHNRIANSLKEQQQQREPKISTKKNKKPQKKSFWKRTYDSFVNGKSQQAQDVIKKYQNN